jgi:tetratricopeptide (TPR) repeat protein
MIMQRVSFKVFSLVMLLQPLSPVVLFSGELDYDEVIIEKAKLSYLNRNYRETLELSLKILDKDKTNLDALLLCAESAYNLKEYERARGCFEQIFHIYPGMKEEYSKDYGIVLYRSGRVEDGERLLKTVFERDKEDEVVRYYLGEILMKRGEEREAESHLKFVFEKRGEFFIPAGVLLSEVYIKRGDEEGVRRILELLEKESISELSPQIIRGISRKITTRKEYYKKLTMDLSIGVGYDTNSTYITEMEDEREKDRNSAFSQLSLEMVYNPVIDARKRLYLQLDFIKSLYFEEYARQFDRLVLNPKVGYKFFVDDLRRTQIGFGYEYYNNFFSGGERVGFNEFGSYYQSNGVFGEVNRRFEHFTGVIRDDFSFVEYEDHNRSAFENRLILSISAPVLKRGNIFASFVFGINDARLNIYDYYACGGNAGFQIPFSKNITFYGIASYEYRGFFDNPSDRIDKVISSATGLEYLFSNRYYISIDGSYLNIDSNLPQYTFDKGVVSFRTGFYY